MNTEWLFKPPNDINRIWSDNPGMKYHKEFQDFDKNQMLFVIFMGDNCRQNPFLQVIARHGDRAAAKEIAIARGWVTPTGLIKKRMAGWVLGESQMGRKVYNAINYYRGLCEVDLMDTLMKAQAQLIEYMDKDAAKTTPEEHTKFAQVRMAIDKGTLAKIAEQKQILIQIRKARLEEVIAQSEETDEQEEVGVLDPDE